ncbi:MAG: hypothetical protein IPK82_42680 [Polyangiaceae bacterium]|nr:hypothetical protein [Polyangiaceae bacterium]
MAGTQDAEGEEGADGPIVWDIHRQGRAWTPDEFEVRAAKLVGMELEISRGKLLWSDSSRLLLLGMLLENMGMDAALRLGDLERWKEALAAVEKG